MSHEALCGMQVTTACKEYRCPVQKFVCVLEFDTNSPMYRVQSSENSESGALLSSDATTGPQLALLLQAMPSAASALLRVLLSLQGETNSQFRICYSVSSDVS